MSQEHTKTHIDLRCNLIILFLFLFFAGKMLQLRCKTKNGSHIMQGLTHQSCVQELKKKVEELTGIPCDVQKIMVGYPPSSLDLRNGDAHLKDYPIKSGM